MASMKQILDEAYHKEMTITLIREGWELCTSKRFLMKNYFAKAGKIAMWEESIGGLVWHNNELHVHFIHEGRGKIQPLI
jgi:hypothetical protein